MVCKAEDRTPLCPQSYIMVRETSWSQTPGRLIGHSENHKNTGLSGYVCVLGHMVPLCSSNCRLFHALKFRFADGERK